MTNTSSGKTKTGRTNTTPPKVKQPTRLDQLEALLKREDGASIEEMADATGWQPHSIRGAMAGALKKRGHVITSNKANDIRRYQIEAAT